MRIGLGKKGWLAWWLSAALLLGMAKTLDAAEPAILVMGDSLSAGYGIKVENGWVALLGKRLTEQGYHYRIINASVSGETSGGGKVRLAELLSIHKPALMILELGANDGLRGLPITALRSNLSAMINSAQQAQVKVLLIGMQLPPNYGPAYVDGFKMVFAELAKSGQLPLVPFLLQNVALDTKLLQADNLHPNELGQPYLLNTVWPTLKKMLQR